MPTTEQVVVKATGPEEVIALVAHTLGFWPHRSLVLVSLRGPRRRSGLVLRVDLDELLGVDDPDLRRGAAQLVGPIADDAASAAFVLVCDDRGGVDPRHHDLTGAVRDALGARGIALQEAVLVDGARLHALSCTSSCCPPGGRPLRDVAATVVGAEMVARGRAVSADRAEVVSRLLAGVAPGGSPGERAERRRVDDLLDAADLTGARAAPGSSARAVREWFALLDATAAATGPVEGALAPRTPDEAAAAVLDPERSAGLLAGMDDLLVRDAVLLGVVPEARADLAGSAFEPAGGLRARVAAATARLDATQDAGDPEVLAAAEALARRLARLAPGRRRAQPLAVLAYWGWWRGSTVEATVLAEEALGADPDHSLAGLVVRLADGAVAPEWVLAERDELAVRDGRAALEGRAQRSGRGQRSGRARRPRRG